MDMIVENNIFRFIYCNLVNTNESCSDFGNFLGILPSGFEWLAFLISGFLLCFIYINGILGAVILSIWGERRLYGRFQNRSGPNRWGPMGVFTSTADAIKVMFKEDVVPVDADKFLFNLAPVLMVFPVFMVFSVIPVGIGTFVVDLNVGLLFILAVTSLSGLAVVIASWASGNRISIFSGLRAVAVLISYEIPMALSLVGVLMLSGTLSLNGIVEAQKIPFILLQPLGFFVFFLASLAEINRTPFDLTEAESELGAGYLNDYSSMKFGIFFLAEFAATIGASAVIATVFLAGWRGPEILPSHIWFGIKLILVLGLIVWVRMSWPRMRIDQILHLAWKGLFELTLINIIVTAIMISIKPDPSVNEMWIMAIINWVICIFSLIIVSKFLNRSAKDNFSNLKNTTPYPVGTEKIKSSFINKKEMVN